MSISIQVNNGIVVKLKLDQTFGDLLNNISGQKGKIENFEFIFDGGIQEVKSNTKLSQYFANRDQAQVQIQEKGQLVIPLAPKPEPQPVNPPVPKQINVVKSPLLDFPNIMQKPVIVNKRSARKAISYVHNVDKLEEQIDQYLVKICERGNRVELEDFTNDFKVIFLEENAKPERVQNIKQQLSPTAYITDPQQIAKLTVGVNNEYTKVIFKNDYRGIAIQWATGLYTLREFNIQP